MPIGLQNTGGETTNRFGDGDCKKLEGKIIPSDEFYVNTVSQISGSRGEDIHNQKLPTVVTPRDKEVIIKIIPVTSKLNVTVNVNLNGKHQPNNKEKHSRK